MNPYHVVLDTNVIVAALRSSLGASYKLLSLVGSTDFEIHLSVPLVLEYEDVAKRLVKEGSLSETEIDDILDYLCSVARLHEVFFLWRPLLKDPKDEMVLELAVAGQCDYIVTFNERDFAGIDQFGIQAISPRDFLELLGELS